LQEFKKNVTQVREIIERQPSRKIEAIISHLLRALVANRIPDIFRKFSFEVCPVYITSRCNTDKFIDQINQKMKYPIAVREILKLLEDLNKAIARYDSNDILSRGKLFICQILIFIFHTIRKLNLINSKVIILIYLKQYYIS